MTLINRHKAGAQAPTVMSDVTPQHQRRFTHRHFGCMCSHMFIPFYFMVSLYVKTYSSSPKKTLTGSQASPQTLKRSGSELISFISSSVSSQPSSWKLPWMRDAVTDLGMTLEPRCRPHMSKTCWTDLPLLSASFLSFSFL